METMAAVVARHQAVTDVGPAVAGFRCFPPTTDHFHFFGHREMETLGSAALRAALNRATNNTRAAWAIVQRWASESMSREVFGHGCHNRGQWVFKAMRLNHWCYSLTVPGFGGSAFEGHPRSPPKYQRSLW